MTFGVKEVGPIINFSINKPVNALPDNTYNAAGKAG
jgi:hypothetical protein